jgi:benzoate/toluate 1,2-dioxygenase alpha subunit
MDDGSNIVDVWDNNPLGLDGSRVIDRSIYVDPGIFTAERDQVFARTWQWIAHESELPNFGDYVTATIAGRPVVVSRGEGGVVHAFLNTCTHRGAILAAKPRGNSGGSFVCLYHAWCFNEAGKFTAAPLPQAYGDRLIKERYDAPTVRVELFAGHVFVNLDPNAEPLDQFLGQSGVYLEACTKDQEAIGRVRWMLDGNWKLWHENFRDNYHPMFAHQMIGLNYQGVKIEGENYDLQGGHSVMTFPLQGNPDGILSAIRRITGRPIEPRPRGPAPTDAGQTILAIFPNLDFQSAVGIGPGHSLLQVVRPVGVDKAIVEIVVFGPKGEPSEVRQSRLEATLDGQTAAGKISGDDTEAVRRCAAGFGALREVRWSNMDRGQQPGLQGDKNDEYSLRAFYVAYKQYMGSHLWSAAQAQPVA